MPVVLLLIVVVLATLSAAGDIIELGCMSTSARTLALPLTMSSLVKAVDQCCKQTCRHPVAASCRSNLSNVLCQGGQ
jgi:hypothetical protein